MQIKIFSDQCDSTTELETKVSAELAKNPSATIQWLQSSGRSFTRLTAIITIPS